MKKLLVVLCFVLPLEVLALSGNEHTKDMQEVFPFEYVKGQNDKIFEFYRLVNAYLDYPGQDPHDPYDKHAPRRPQFVVNHEKFQNITWKGKHRIWYHWGFNADPHHYVPLVNSLDTAVKLGVIEQTDVSIFWEMLEDDVAERNRMLMEDGAKVFGFNSLDQLSNRQRRQLNGLVTVLYSVHVIGDHLTTDSLIVIPLCRVYADVYNAIANIAGKDVENAMKAKSLVAKLDHAKSTPTMFLDMLKREFTPFILSLKGSGYNYRERFVAMGYKLKSI